MGAHASRRVLTLPVSSDFAENNIALAGEYEQQVIGLKLRLDEAKAQIAALQIRLKDDGAMPVMRTKAFVNEVRQQKKSIAPSNERRSAAKGPGCLAEVTVVNLTAILERFGDRASEIALTHVAEILRGHIRETDTVGRLGTASFGVLLAYADPALAEAKMHKLCTRIENSPTQWEGKDVAVRVSTRVAALTS